MSLNFPQLAQVRNSQRQQQEGNQLNHADAHSEYDPPSVAVQTSPVPSPLGGHSTPTFHEWGIRQPQIISNLGHQIDVFAQAVDDFKQERAISLTSIAASNHHMEMPNTSALSYQIDLFAQAVDKLKEERAILSKSVASPDHQPEADPAGQDEPDKTPFGRVLAIEKECIRLVA